MLLAVLKAAQAACRECCWSVNRAAVGSQTPPLCRAHVDSKHTPSVSTSPKPVRTIASCPEGAKSRESRVAPKAAQTKVASCVSMTVFTPNKSDVSGISTKYNCNMQMFFLFEYLFEKNQFPLSSKHNAGSSFKVN